MKRRILISLMVLLGLAFSAVSQEVVSDTLQQEQKSDTTIYFTPQSGRIVKLTPAAELMAKEAMKYLIDSVLNRYLPLFDSKSRSFPPQFEFFLKEYFDVSVYDMPVIPNLFEPVNSTQLAEGYKKPDYISLNDYIHDIPESFKARGIRFTINSVTENIMIIKSKNGERMAMQLIKWECQRAYPQIDNYDMGEMSVDSVFALWVKLPAFERDYYDVSKYRIMSISQSNIWDSKGLRNHWAFIKMSAGYIYAMEGVELNEKRFSAIDTRSTPSFQVGMDFEMFIGDTTSLGGQDWDFRAFRFGFGVGGRFIQQNTCLLFDNYEYTYGELIQSQSPVGNLIFDSYNLKASLDNIEQHYSNNVVSIPVYAIGEFSFDAQRKHSVTLRLGAAFNYTISSNYYTIGMAKYMADNCIIQGSDPFGIMDLPDYGIGAFTIDVSKQELDNFTGDLAVHLYSQAGYLYSPGNRSNWDYGISINYCPQVFSTHKYVENFVDPIQYTDNIGAFRNTVFSDNVISYLGLNLQVSYNIIHNDDKRVRKLR